MVLGSAVLWLSLSAFRAPGQVTREVRDTQGQFFQRLFQLGEEIDWDVESEQIKNSIDRIWTENNWSNESDQFAKKLVTDVSAIPPWEFSNRINLLSQRLAERYDLPDGEQARLQERFMREMGALIGRNSGPMLRNLNEWMQTRSSGAPFTAEQVARWTREAQPMMEEAHRSVDRIVADLRSTVPPEKQHVLDSDVQSYGKRKQFETKMVEKWSRGEWKPSDWGIPEDQPPAPSVPPSKPAGVEVAPVAPPMVPTPGTNAIPAAPSIPPRWLAHDPPTWFAYVLDFQKRFQLDEGQKTATKSIHDELLARAVDYMNTRTEEFKAVPAPTRATSEAYAPIRALFDEMKARLEAVPTTAQRTQAKTTP